MDPFAVNPSLDSKPKSFVYQLYRSEDTVTYTPPYNKRASKSRPHNVLWWGYRQNDGEDRELLIFDDGGSKLRRGDSLETKQLGPQRWGVKELSEDQARFLGITRGYTERWHARQAAGSSSRSFVHTEGDAAGTGYQGGTNPAAFSTSDSLVPLSGSYYRGDTTHNQSSSSSEPQYDRPPQPSTPHLSYLPQQSPQEAGVSGPNTQTIPPLRQTVVGLYLSPAGTVSPTNSRDSAGVQGDQSTLPALLDRPYDPPRSVAVVGSSNTDRNRQNRHSQERVRRSQRQQRQQRDDVTTELDPETVGGNDSTSVHGIHTRSTYHSYYTASGPIHDTSYGRQQLDQSQQSEYPASGGSWGTGYVLQHYDHSQQYFDSQQ